MKNEPTVSVIMPVYNTERYVAEALKSILSQSYKNLEVICIDDGSTDGTLSVLEKFKDRIIILKNEHNMGIAPTRNKGLSAAHGDFIAFMDADDIWKPEKLEKQLQEFEKNPELGICFTMMESFISPELPEEVKKTRYCPTGAQPGQISAAALIKTELFGSVGLFEERWKMGEFIDWYSKAKDMGYKSATLNDVLYLRRIHDANTGVNERSSRTDYLKIVKNAITRRRNAEKEKDEDKQSPLP